MSNETVPGLNRIQIGATTVAFLLIFTSIAMISSMDVEEDEYEEILLDALIYTYPMILFERTKETQSNTILPTESKAPINQFIHTQHLSNSDFKDFTMPNVDTIYSVLNYDVMDEPFVLFLPDPDRFYNLQVLSAWIDVIYVMGSGGEDLVPTAVCGPGFDVSTLPEGLNHVISPTNSGLIGSRTMIDGDLDLQNVIDIQNEMRFVPLSYYHSKEDYVPPQGEYDPSLEFVPRDEVERMTIQEYFNLANEKMLTNRPNPGDEDMLKKLAKINVGPGLEFDSSIFGKYPARAWNVAVKALPQLTLEDSQRFFINDGIWNYQGDPIGDFGTEYKYRAFIAYYGYVANPTSVAIYINATEYSDGMDLTGSNSYIIHLETGQFPPYIESDRGFWSITAYNGSQFLIENEIDRYSINNRMHLKENPDGSVDILVSNERPDDITNWLPVTGDGEKFMLTLRIYIPDKDAIDAGWECPQVEMMV